MRFVAIDVETANPRYHSICQIGVVLFEGGQEVAAERMYVNPREEFGIWQMRVHGIQPEDVARAPAFEDIHDWLYQWTRGETVVSHSHFDRSAIGMACSHHRLPSIDCEWIDSLSLARQAWPDLESFKLADLASRLGIRFLAHDALEDARACGLIVQRALSGAALGDSQLDQTRLRRGFPEHVKRVGDGDGGLLGESIVFTGELSINRGQAADMAALAGGDVQQSVTRQTTMLVVGERDLQPGWHAKSTKHRKAENMIEKGLDIRIVSEADFLALAAITE